MTPLRILGIDPGFDRLGFGVIEECGNDLAWIHHACLQTKSTDAFTDRLKQLRDALVLTIRKFKPDGAAVEQIFFQTNVKTAIHVGMARGVILLALADLGVPVVEMTPNQLKQGITGDGRADKKQIQLMVKRLLKLNVIPKPDDAADALAIAIVGGTMFKSLQKKTRG